MLYRTHFDLLRGCLEFFKRSGVRRNGLQPFTPGHGDTPLHTLYQPKQLKKLEQLLRVICILLSLAVSTIACGEDVSGVKGAVVDSESNTNKLRQLLMVLNLTDAEGRHVVVAGIDSVKLNVNGRPWGVFPSEPLDTDGIATVTAGNLNVTDQPIGYLVIAQYEVALDSLETAGAYATYLHNRLRIPPGDYICEVAEVQFRDAANNVVTVKPHVYRSFTVAPNIASLFLGEINAKVN